MIKFEDECCGCAAPGYPWLGSSCHNRNVPHYYCDDCGDEADIYEFEGDQLCINCIEKRLEKVEA